MLQAELPLPVDHRAPPIPRAVSSPSRSAPRAATATLPARPPVNTFQDAVAYVGQRSDWTGAARTVLKSALRRVAWSIALIEARKTGRYLDPDRKKLDLATIPFDIPTINQALEGVSYRLAGFNNDKSFRNAKSGLRRVGRELGKVAPMRSLELPPDSPYALLLTVTDPWNEAAVRGFAARMYQQGRHPREVTGADLSQHGIFLRTERIGVKVNATLRRIALTWRRAADCHPDWPQAPLALSTPPRPVSPPFSAYPASLQEEIVIVRRWMEGGQQYGPFGGQFARKPWRPATITYRLACIRIALGVLVEQGADPASVTSLRLLFVPDTTQAILQAVWERAQRKVATQPDTERDHDPAGMTNQPNAIAQILLTLATHCFPQPSDVLAQLRDLARAVRPPKRGEMSRRNRMRLAQFTDPVKLGLLLRLPYTMMQEAMAMRADRPAEAARLARAAVFFGIEGRIPLRISNLQSCRLGHNLRFAGTNSEIVTLGFQAYETKNWLEIEFYVGPRLCRLLKTYIEHFLPVFAANAPDFAAKQWLFPAGEGRAGPLSVQQVRKIITDTVAERVGAVFHPHLFRALAVRLCLDHSPGALEQCRQLLGDKTLQVVLAHYAPIQRKEAAQHLDRLVSAEEDRLRVLATTAGRRRQRKASRP